ncbi:MAG: dynamin family protein [Thermoanaerobaculia bacterium]
MLHVISDGNRHDVIVVLEAFAQKAISFADDIAVTPMDGGKEIHDALVAAAELAKREVRNISEPFRLGVIGMFKAGKSSVINTFLGRELLREGRVEATAALTQLRFALTPEDEHGEIVYHDREPLTLPLVEALEYTDIRTQRFRDLGPAERRAMQESITQIVLHVHSDLLRTVVLVDTPGFGGSHVGDRKAFDALGMVDAALMIFAADRIGSANELEVADRLYKTGREIVGLLNKIDNGAGAPLPAAEIETSEAFLRTHFRTIVANDKGSPAIYRYSALEVARALKALSDATLPEEQRAQARAALVTWGYAESGQSDAEKGVIAFIRDRYFSSGSASSYLRKLTAARKSVLSSVHPLLDSIDGHRKEAEENSRNAQSEMDKTEQAIQDEILPRMKRIEADVEDIITQLVQRFARDLEEALLAIVHRLQNLDLVDMVKSFRRTDVIAAELEKEFRANFPPSREESLRRDIERKISRLLSQQWLFVTNDIHKLHAEIPMPITTQLLSEVNNAVRVVTVASATALGAMFLGLLGPAGALVGAIIMLASQITGLSFGERHANRLAQWEHKVKLQVHNYADNLIRELYEQAKSANDTLADKAAERNRSAIGGAEERRNQHTSVAERWRRLHRDLRDQSEALEKIQLSTS